MSRKITELFNEYYKLYLNNYTTNLIDSYIQKNIIYIFNLQYNYKLSYNLLKEYDHFYKSDILFNNIIIGFLYINIENNNINEDYNLFILYLGILLNNIKITETNNKTNNKINNKIDDVNISGIYNEILNILDNGIYICDHYFNIIYKNSASDIFTNTLNYNRKKQNILNHNNKENYKENLYDIFVHLKDILKKEDIYKNKKINYNCENNNSILNIIICVNTILYNNIYYNIITITNNTKTDKLQNDGFISHELRNPLQSISFANHLIITKNKDDNLKKYLNIINKSVYDMIKIINDMLDIDKIDSNKMNITIENIHMKDLLDNINFQYSSYINNNLELQYSSLVNDNIDFKINLNENVPKTLFTDLTRTNQIILNLLINSLKYSKPNVKNNIILEVTYDENNKCIEFNMIDNGIGIKDSYIKKIFKSRYEYINSNNSNGLGLYICNKLANLLGGYIKIYSEYMNGSRFTFIHPINLGNINLTLQKNIENLNINGNILIYDNNENIILLLSDIFVNIKYKYNLINFNYAVINNKENILDIIESCDYNMIFFDINDINDINIIKILRRKKYSGKIIIMTQNVNIKLDLILFDGILIKPFSETDVLDKIKLL
jgi:signal transduction histidine kinase